MTTLRIGYTCHDAFPSTTTNTQQVFWTLTEVANLGASVDLHVPALRSNADIRPLLARHYGRADTRVPDTLRVMAHGTVPPRGALARARFDLRAARAFSPATHDVLWTRDPLALVGALRRGIPTVFETYRPDFATARAFAPWRAACLRHPHLAGVITHSRLASEAFVQAGVAPERVLVAHNGYAPSLMEPALSTSEARARLGYPADVPLVVYTGHVGPQKGTDALIEMAASLPHACLVIVGVEPDSASGRWLEGLASHAGTSNLLLVPRVDVADVAPYLYAADCLVIPPTDEPLRRYGRTVLPMKLFPYLAAGRPILAPRLPDIEEVLVDDEDAVLVPAGDPRAAAEALAALMADPARGARLGRAAATKAVRFTWQARAASIVSFLEARAARR